jgi:alpha-tubulin suppressor-like RCC1 family protein
VANLNGVTAVDAGDRHTLALKQDGTVWAWGRNQYGQLGDGTTVEEGCACRVTPAPVVGLTDVVAIRGGTYHSLALKDDGTVWGWGRNFTGQLGDGSITDRLTPVQVKTIGGSPLTGVVAIAAGDGHNLALKGDGTVWAWGWNRYGQLGDGTSASDEYLPWPVQVKGAGGSGVLTGVTAIAAGERHSLAIRSDGTAWAWGWNIYGQLGDGTEGRNDCSFGDACRQTPVQVSGLAGVRAIAGGGKHSLAVTDDGQVWAWGANDNYQLGLLPEQLGSLSHETQLTPIQVPGVSGASAVTAGYDSSFALRLP